MSSSKKHFIIEKITHYKTTIIKHIINKQNMQYTEMVLDNSTSKKSLRKFKNRNFDIKDVFSFFIMFIYHRFQY